MLKVLAASAAAALSLAACTTTTTREVTYYPGGARSEQVRTDGYGGYERTTYSSYTYRGCESDEAVGTVAGAVAGGVIGGQFGGGSDDRAMAAVGGAVLGGIAGNAIARNGCRNDRADAYYYNSTYSDAFEDAGYGRRHEWRNPHTGRYGYVTPRRAVDGYSYGYDNECREFEQIVYVDGYPYTDTGIACRNPDGTWRIVSS